MMVNRDFVELLQSFDDHDVQFLIVGAHALAAHGHVRATRDLDVFLRPTAENADLRPFQMRVRSSSLAATRVSVAPEAARISISRSCSSATCGASPSSSTMSRAAAWAG